MPAREEEVRRLEIAVDDPGGVSLRERVERLQREVGDLGDREHAALRGGCPRGRTRRRYFPEDHVRRARRELPDVEDAGDVLALDLRGGARLVHEAVGRFLGADELAEEQLHGHALIEEQVLGREHRTHSAATDEPLDPVFAREDVAGGREVGVVSHANLEGRDQEGGQRPPRRQNRPRLGFRM